MDEKVPYPVPPKIENPVAGEEIDDFRNMVDEIDDLRQQLDDIVELIIEEIPGKPTPTESSVDFAIRLLTTGNQTKDDKIVKECKKSGEPYIVFRAKDDLASGTIQFYMIRAVDEKCEKEFVEKIKQRFNEFQEWRGSHSYRTRLPD